MIDRIRPAQRSLRLGGECRRFLGGECSACSGMALIGRVNRSRGWSAAATELLIAEPACTAARAAVIAFTVSAAGPQAVWSESGAWRRRPRNGACLLQASSAVPAGSVSVRVRLWTSSEAVVRGRCRGVGDRQGVTAAAGAGEQGGRQPPFGARLRVALYRMGGRGRGGACSWVSGRSGGVRWFLARAVGGTSRWSRDIHGFIC